MRYQDIRMAFPKCGTAVTDYGIMLVFPQYNPSRRVSQTISGKFHNHDVFLHLLQESNEFIVRLSPCYGTCVLFAMPMPVDRDMIWPPVTPELSETEQIKKIASFIHNKDGGKRLIEMFDGIDLNDIEQVKEAFLSFQPKDNDLYLLSEVRRWTELQKYASEFRKLFTDGEYFEEPPDENLDFGVANLTFETDTEKAAQFKISGLQKEAFEKLCGYAAVVSIEGCTEQDGAFLTMEFYS